MAHRDRGRPRLSGSPLVRAHSGQRVLRTLAGFVADRPRLRSRPARRARPGPVRGGRPGRDPGGRPVTEPVQALVVVDMQRGLLTGPEAVAGAAALTERVEQLIRRATDAGALVVQLQNDGPLGQVDE